MIGLTDIQLKIVMNAARLLPVEKRDTFLQRIAAMLALRGRGRFTDVISSVRYRSGMAVWDRVAAAVTHRRSWAIALLIAVGGGVFIALAGPNSGADKAPLQLPPSAESARGAALLRTFPAKTNSRRFWWHPAATTRH